MSFEKLLLAVPIQKALSEANYGSPTPIQRDAIPIILDGFDLIGCAQTGSGKTAAFALPVLHHICEKPVELGPRECRTVVLTPTRELATQVARSFRSYGKHLDISVDTVVGGMPMGPQINALKQGLDIVVGTPGRMLDLIEQRKISFQKTDHLILDEVDRMFDMGFVQDVKKIIKRIPDDRQTLCFSATIEDSINKLIQAITKDAVTVTVDSDSKSCDQVEQASCFIRNQDKSELVCHLIKEEAVRDPDSKVLIFVSTKQGADHLQQRLKEANAGSDALHGDKPQKLRERVLDKFRSGRNNVLIATDVAARGLDIKGIDLVLNYDIPQAGDSYVHRIGRTGRAGKPGRACTFCAEFDQPLLNNIERFLGMDIPPLTDHPYHSETLLSRYKMLYSTQAAGAGTAPASSGMVSGMRRSNRRNRAKRS